MEYTNSEMFEEFFKELHQEYGNLVIFLNNASYHKYKTVVGNESDGIEHVVRPEELLPSNASDPYAITFL